MIRYHHSTSLQIPGGLTDDFMVLGYTRRRHAGEWGDDSTYGFVTAGWPEESWHPCPECSYKITRTQWCKHWGWFDRRIKREDVA